MRHNCGSSCGSIRSCSQVTSRSSCSSNGKAFQDNTGSSSNINHDIVIGIVVDITAVVVKIFVVVMVMVSSVVAVRLV